MSLAAPALGSRALFPQLAAKVYLGHAAVSPISTPIAAALTRWIDAAASDGVAGFGRGLEARAACKAQLATMFGVPATTLALVGSTTQGVQIVAQSLRVEPGDAIVVLRGEFPTNVVPWLKAAEARGLEVRWLDAERFRRAPDTASDTLAPGLADLEAVLADRRVRLVAVSAVQFQTGLAMPLAAIAERAHACGARVAVDAIQAAGVVPLALAGIDFATGGSHKFLMGVPGAGWLYVAPDALDALDTRMHGWLSLADPVGFLFPSPEGHGVPIDYHRPSRAEAAALEAGSHATGAFVAFAAALELLNTLGVPAIHAHVQAYLDRLEPELVRLGARSLRSPHADERSGTLSLVVPPRVTIGAAAAAFERAGIRVSTPEGFLRLAPHWPNALAECEEVLTSADAAFA